MTATKTTFRRRAKKIDYRNVRNVDGRQMRFRIEWSETVLDRMIRRAAIQKGGQAVFGPIRLVVHPDDRS